MKELLAPTTSADTSKKIIISDDRFVSVAANGLAGAEEVTFDIDLNGTWVAIATSSTPKLDASNNLTQLAGPNTYRVNKDATVASVGVYLVD